MLPDMTSLFIDIHFRFEGYSIDIAPNEQEEVSILKSSIH